MSEIAESAEIVKLETGDDVLVGRDPDVKLVDTLLLVFSYSNGLQFFDSRTGDYKYSLRGYKDRGPLGWGGVDDIGLYKRVIYGNKILLVKWGTWGLWDFTTGEMLDDDVPLGNLFWDESIYFVNDSVIIVNKGIVNPERDADKVFLISAVDGRKIHGFGLIENVDTPNGNDPFRSHLYEYNNNFTYYSKVCDTIYGINAAMREMYPRFVLNIPSRDRPENTNEQSSTFYSTGVTLWNIFESDRYLFLKYGDQRDDFDESIANGVIETDMYYVCYDKIERRILYADKDTRIRYAGANIVEKKYPGFVDDLTPLGIPFFPHGVSSDCRVYQIIQPVDIVSELGIERAAELGITEDDNPVIVIAKLKK